MSEYLYVCHFSNGHIKVGRSISPKSRIASHADRVSCLGVELVEHHIVECVGHSAPAEAALIECCAELATKRNKNEWFEGLEYDVICEIAHSQAVANFVQSSTDFTQMKYRSKSLASMIDAEVKAAICKEHGFGKGYLAAILGGAKKASPKLCVAIEQRTNKIVTRQELRPNDWHLIWPELTEKATA